MEKNFYDQFKLMELRPAIYKDKQIDRVPVVFYENSMYRVETEEVEALGMKIGDTVELGGKIISDEEPDASIYIDLYLSEAVLTEFIENYGYKKLKGKVVMKLQLMHEVVESDLIMERTIELTGYKVLAIYPDIK